MVMMACLVAVTPTRSLAQLRIMEIMPRQAHVIMSLSKLGCGKGGSQVSSMGVGEMQLVTCCMGSWVGHSRGGRGMEVLVTMWVVGCT